MPDPEENQDPPQDNPQEENKDSNKEQSQNNTHIENEGELPEKFKGKSASEIAKSYVELEKKLGAESVSKKRLAELEQLRDFIVADPELVEALKKKAEKPSTTTQDNKPTRPDDTREAVTVQIVNDFEKDRGIDRLKTEDRKALHERIGQELKDILDPSGTRSLDEIVADINLTRLPQYLDKAYRLATIGDEAEQARLKGITEARQNNEATFGSFTSSGSKGNSKTLTEDQRATAKKLGVSEEKYLEQLKKLD